MPSQSSQVRDMAAQVPLCTFCIMALCIGLQVYLFLFDTRADRFHVLSANVIYLGEYYRIISAALLHSNLLHIVFNMSSFLTIGSNMEMTIGTLGLAFLISWSIILDGAIYVAAEWALTVWVTQDPQYVYQRAVGFSGVLFTLALMESHRSTTPYRSIFGFIQVPTKLYPWALLVVLSVILPGISFMGHLSGILVGVLHVYGYTKPLLPSPAYLVEMESFPFIRNSVVRRTNFVPCPRPSPGSEETVSLSDTVQEMCAPICLPLQRGYLRLVNGGGRQNRSSDRAGDIEASARFVQADV